MKFRILTVLRNFFCSTPFSKKEGAFFENALSPPSPPPWHFQSEEAGSPKGSRPLATTPGNTLANESIDILGAPPQGQTPDLGEKDV